MSKDFGQITNALLEKLEFTQNDLAEILGVRQSSIARYSATSGPSGDQGIKLMILSSILDNEDEYVIASEILSRDHGKLIMRTILTLGCSAAEPLYWAWLHEDEAEKLTETYKEVEKLAAHEIGKTVAGVVGGAAIGAMIGSTVLAPTLLFGGARVLASVAGGLASYKLVKQLFSSKAEYEKAYNLALSKRMNSGTLSGILKSPAIHDLYEYLTETLNKSQQS